MPSDIIHIPIDGPSAQLGAVMYLSILAYPDDSSKRNRFAEALQAWWGKEYINRGGDKNKVPEWIRKYRTDKIFPKGPIGPAIDRITSKRLPAAEMASFILVNSDYHMKIYLNGEPVSVNHAADYLVDLGSQTERPDVIKRIWTPSKPVLHLASSLRSYLLESGSKTFNIYKLILTPDWLHQALRNAELKRVNSFTQDPRFHIPEKTTIQLLPE